MDLIISHYNIIYIYCICAPVFDVTLAYYYYYYYINKYLLVYYIIVIIIHIYMYIHNNSYKQMRIIIAYSLGELSIVLYASREVPKPPAREWRFDGR
jgi:hypothetical protein